MFRRSPISSLGLRLFQADQYISLNQVRMVYGNRCVFESLNCTFPRQKISVVLGGSGLGKSTLLRLIGGLVRPDGGTVKVDGERVDNLSGRGLAKVRRKMGMMFQGGALLDSYSVFENVALPLREQGRLTPAQIKSAVREILDAVSVCGVDDLHPRQLSGGMLRRVALARAIIRKPELLLCDEPFSGLDPASIKRMEALLVKINKQSGMTMIMVSHDIQSTLRMADQVLMVLPGRVLVGSPDELLHSDDPEISEFLGRGTDAQP